LKWQTISFNELKTNNSE